MIEAKCFRFKNNQSENSKNNQCYHFLNYFQLNERKGTAITFKT